jgi:hypothetical protein
MIEMENKGEAIERLVVIIAGRGERNHSSVVVVVLIGTPRHTRAFGRTLRVV